MERRRIYITRGLPASGKSTYAKKYVLDHDDTKRVNRDDLRTMLSGYALTWENQAIVLKIEQNIIETILLSGYNVMSDNMYIRAEEMKNLTQFITEFETKNPTFRIEVVIVDFTDVSLELCIQRDAERIRQTGADVIKKLHQTLNDQNVEFVNLFMEQALRHEK